MTTAQIVAIALIVCAASDFIIGYFWLVPKLKDPNDHTPLAEPLKSNSSAENRRRIKLIKGVLDIWAVIALAIAYFLWNNPDTF